MVLRRAPAGCPFEARGREGGRGEEIYIYIYIYIYISLSINV